VAGRIVDPAVAGPFFARATALAPNRLELPNGGQAVRRQPPDKHAYHDDMRARRKNLFGSCYGLRESLGWWIRNRLGPRNNVNSDLEPIFGACVLDGCYQPQVEIGFVGDIMDLHGHQLTITEGIVKKTRAVDFLVGNFEATITDREGLYHAQIFTPEILPLLTSLKDPDHFFLSTANNHAGDFGQDEFLRSCDLATRAGFGLFGLSNAPFVDLTPRVRLVTATQWSNLTCDYVPVLDPLSEAAVERLNALIKPGAINILYLHWGYELELYPRPSIVRLARALIRSFDMIVGHHPHVPQPCTREPAGDRRRPVAYSLGNFITGRRKEMKQYGLLLRVRVGPDASGSWGIRDIETQLTRCAWSGEKRFSLACAEAYPYSNLAAEAPG
jgi:hypothetical protein